MTLSTAASTTLAVAVTAAGAALGVYLWRNRRKRPPKLIRNMSFTSAYLAIGTYAEKAQFAEPIINAALYFDHGDLPTDQEIVEQAVQPMLCHARLSMIPVKDKAGSLREPSPPLDPTKLVRRIQVASEQEIYQTISKDVFPDLLGNNPHRADLPWWEFLVLENTGEGQSVVIWRIHHALGDGISLAEVMVRHVLKPVAGSSESLTCLPPKMMSQKSSLLEERTTKFTWCQRVGQVCGAVGTIVGLPFGAFDHPTVFSKASCKKDLVHNGKRDIVIFPTVPLSFVQALKRAAKVTLNDVVFAVISQAIHTYLKQEDCPVLKELGSQLQCRSLLASAIPRDMSQATTYDLLQNKWVLLSAEMSVGCDDILDRLGRIHETFRQLKTSPLAYITMQVQNNILKHLPLALNRQSVYDMMIRHSVTVSNVPGPTQPVLFCGKEVKGVQMFFSNLCSEFAIFSYAGKVHGNLTVDPESLPNYESLADHYRQALITLAQRLEVPIPPELQQ